MKKQNGNINDFFWFAPPVSAQAEGQGAMLHCVGLRNFGFAKLRTNARQLAFVYAGFRIKREGKQARMNGGKVLLCDSSATCKKRGVIEIQNYRIMTEINKSTDLENTTKQPCFLHDVMGSVYHWMISNLPYRIMYKHVRIDSQHKMWLPRWGWSKRQIADAEKRAKELAENIKWE